MRTVAHAAALLATFGILAACHGAGRQGAGAYGTLLQASMRAGNADATIGQEFSVTFVLKNVGQVPVEACFGEAFNLIFMAKDQARARTEDMGRPVCKRRFLLQPGAETSETYVARVPKVAEGPAQLVGMVQVVDPATCGKHGCDFAVLGTSAQLDVTVKPRVPVMAPPTPT